MNPVDKILRADYTGLPQDLQNELPEEKGFSRRSIKCMSAFSREYSTWGIVSQPVAQRESDLQVQHAAALFPGDFILYQQSNRILAEYALRGMNKPIGVSEFELTRALPEELQSSLPSIEQIESELEGRDD